MAAHNGLLIDLDGVIYQSDRLIAGAAEALAWIRQQQIPHLFVTNTTSRSRNELLEKFASLGFSAQLEDVMTPVIAANQWLHENQLRKAALFVPRGTQQDFGDIESIALDTNLPVDAVVIGDLGEAWDFRLMNSAFRFLMQNPRPHLIALGMTRYWRGREGLLLDVAAFVKALEHAASCEAIVVGKPAAAFFDSSLAILQCSAAHTFMIGDDIVGDIGAAQACGIRGIQVMTGKFREEDLNGDIKPFAVLVSFADFPGWWAQTLVSSR